MEALQNYLKAKKLSQAAFAEMVGVSQPTVCEWLNGKIQPTTDSLRNISRTTGLSIDKLLANATRKSGHKAT